MIAGYSVKLVEIEPTTVYGATVPLEHDNKILLITRNFVSVGFKMQNVKSRFFPIKILKNPLSMLSYIP